MSENKTQEQHQQDNLINMINKGSNNMGIAIRKKKSWRRKGTGGGSKVHGGVGFVHLRHGQGRSPTERGREGEEGFSGIASSAEREKVSQGKEKGLTLRGMVKPRLAGILFRQLAD